MRKIIILLSLIPVIANSCYADIFTTDKTPGSYTINNAVSDDKSGFYYRGGIDYNPPVAPVERSEERRVGKEC